ncbi:hypothetical protein EYV94_22525 [Puteibacter caeruleilacunae]|nr:hypothetical protein EYV94_22525 [Puteibacter caeruleilacunae]
MMNFLLDDDKIEKQYQHILRQLRTVMNGATAEAMEKKGLKYKVNMGASIVSLKRMASEYEPNHLLALKLWNKKWRETMILATMLEEPDKATEEQLDFWVKSFETLEIAEQAVMNLLPKSRYAFVKALEWCRGKKYLVKCTGLMLMGRLAFIDKSALDEMFEPFFEVIAPLAKDSELHDVYFRSFGQLGRRSKLLNEWAIQFCEQLKLDESEAAKTLANELIEELSSPWVQEMLGNKE